MSLENCYKLVVEARGFSYKNKDIAPEVPPEEYRPQEFGQDQTEAVRKVESYLVYFNDIFPYLRRVSTEPGKTHYHYSNVVKLNPPQDYAGRPIGDIQTIDILIVATRNTPITKETGFFGNRSSTQMGPHENQELALFKMENGEKKLADGWTSIEVHFKGPNHQGRKIVYKYDQDVTDLSKLSD